MGPWRLPAMLLLSIAWLLVNQAEAASNGAARSSSLVARSNLRSRRTMRGQQLQGNNTNLTLGQELLKDDQAAQDDFVRRCQVVVTVSDDKFLPVKPLDRFCQTTDAAMECRMKVGQRLKETHARDGDMGKFCSAVYDWFQGKYGMKCPQQCRKLQCKSTCLWLDAKKKLNEANAEIKVDMLAAEKVLKNIKGISKEVQEKVSEEKKFNFTIKMIGVKIGRAEDSLTEKKYDLGNATAKKAKVSDAATKLEKTIEATEDNLVKRSDAIMKQKFAIDKAKLKLKAMGRASQRDLDRAKEDRDEEKSLKSEADGLAKDIAELEKSKTAVTKTRDSDTKAAKDQEKVVKAKADKMRTAIKELDEFRVQTLLAVKPEQGAAEASVSLIQADPFETDFKKGYHAMYKNDPKVDELKELVKNQYKRTKAADKILQGLLKKIKDSNHQIEELKIDIARLGKQKKAASDKSLVAKGKADALDKKAQDALKEAETFRDTNVTKPTAELKKAEDAQKTEEAKKAKAEKTLKMMQDLLKEEVKKVSDATAAVSNAGMALDAEKQSLVKTKSDLAEVVKQREALQAKEKDMKDHLGDNEKAMMERIKAYKESLKDLEKNKPEIVKLHSLQP